MEFSRDTEMMRGGYFDNYYIQLAYNVQKAKGAAPVVVQDARNPIDVAGAFTQWDAVKFTYHDYKGDTVDRNATGFGRTKYTNDTGRNDIVASKVTADTKNLYFYVETAEAITAADNSSSWMKLYVDIDSDGNTGWYGYDYIINYETKGDNTTTVAKYNGADGKYGFTNVGEVSYKVDGNKMMIAVPQELVGVKDAYKELCFQFKWADSDTTYDEMEDFYIDGDVAPLGRMNYVFQNYVPGMSEITYPWDTEAPTEAPTEEPTDAPTEAPTEAPTDTPTEAPTEPAAQGCGSILSLGLISLISLAATVICVKRKD